MQGGRKEGQLLAQKAEVGCQSPVGAAVQAEVAEAQRRAEGSRRDLGKLLVTLRSCGVIQKAVRN